MGSNAKDCGYGLGGGGARLEPRAFILEPFTTPENLRTARPHRRSAGVGSTHTALKLLRQPAKVTMHAVCTTTRTSCTLLSPICTPVLVWPMHSSAHSTSHVHVCGRCVSKMCHDHSPSNCILCIQHPFIICRQFRRA